MPLTYWGRYSLVVQSRCQVRVAFQRRDPVFYRRSEAERQLCMPGDLV